MPGTVKVLISIVAVLATVSLASTASATGGSGPSSVAQWTAASSPASAAPVAVKAGPTTIRWDKFYDKSGNPLSGGPVDNVGPDSLYFKKYNETDTLYGCPKSQVPNPTPTSCRPAFTFLNAQTRVGMDPSGTYIYEVNGTSLRQHNTSDGTFSDYTVSNGSTCCMTDGSFLYVPVDSVVYKYTLIGNLVSQTTLDITPLQHVFSVANDTVWCGIDAGTLNGYACSKFNGGSIAYDATWSLGSGSGSGVLVCWDGTYYYASWNGNSSPTFKRFNADRTVSASGTMNSDPRGVMCRNNAGFKVLFAGTESDNPTLRAQIVGASGGQITAVDYFDAGSSALQAHSLYQQGYRVIITFGGNYLWTSGAVFGDSLAVFVDLGGGALNMTYTTCAGGDWCIGGRYKDQYMPVPTVAYSGVQCPSITVLEPSHPIMNGVTAIGNFTCEPYTMSVRSPAYSVRIANWDVTDSYIECAAFDSGGRRTVFLGYHPNYNSGGTGQWLTQLVNALIWMGNPIPTVAVTVPNGGESWLAGTTHNIMWSQTSNGVRDSIYYSTDAGSSWTGVAYHDPPPESLQHVWTVPNTPTNEARVKVVTWDSDGGRVEDVSDSNFTIEPFVGIAQPGNNALPLVFVLFQPYPNPLASGVAIRYALPRPARVELRIYDVAGTLVRRLVDDGQLAGYRSAYWNGFDGRGRYVAPGVYYCRLQAGDFTAAQKLVVRR
jgi:hypothetical protein